MARGIPIENARRAGQARLDEQESKRLLAGFGLEVPAGVAIEGTDDLQAALATLQPPLALKLLSPEVAHKSDIGGVRLGLRDEDDVRRALAEMPECDRYLLEEMAPEGVEMILGGVRHPRFGPLVMVAGLVFCPPAEHREPMSGLAIPFSMWQCAGHGDAAGPGFVR